MTIQAYGFMWFIPKQQPVSRPRGEKGDSPNLKTYTKLFFITWQIFIVNYKRFYFVLPFFFPLLTTQAASLSAVIPTELATRLKRKVCTLRVCTLWVCTLWVCTLWVCTLWKRPKPTTSSRLINALIALTTLSYFCMHPSAPEESEVRHAWRKLVLMKEFPIGE